MTDSLGPRRMLYSRFFEDEDVAALSDDGIKLLYLGLLTRTDVWGRCKGDALWARSVVFPLDETKTVQQIEAWLRELHERGLVIRYAADGKKGPRQYIQFPNFHRYQYINNEDREESIYPAPDPEQYPEFAEEERLFRIFLAAPGTFRRGRKFSPEAAREYLASLPPDGHGASGTPTEATTDTAPELTSPDPGINALLDRINALSAELAAAKARLAERGDAPERELPGDQEDTRKFPGSSQDKRKEKETKEKQSTGVTFRDAPAPDGLAAEHDEPFTREPVSQVAARKSPVASGAGGLDDDALFEIDPESTVQRYRALDPETREQVDAVLGLCKRLATAESFLRTLCRKYTDVDVLAELEVFGKKTRGHALLRPQRSLKRWLEQAEAFEAQHARERAARFEAHGHGYVGVPPTTHEVSESYRGFNTYDD